MSKKINAYCEACNEIIDVSEMYFVDYDGFPLVLFEQADTERKAINFIRNKHPSVMDDWELGYEKPELHLYNHGKDMTMSHEEPGADGHKLKGLSGKFWSVQ